MKIIVLAAIAALPFSALAQKSDEFIEFPDNGVYVSPSDFANHKLKDSFDNGQPGYRLREEAFQRTLKVDQPNAPEEKIPLSDVWGERKNGVDYRNFDGDMYRVEHSDRVFIYSKPVNAGTLAAGPIYGSTLYYFSRKANSPIHLITSTSLEDIYYDQPGKKELFDQLDYLKNPADKAGKLIRAFYTTDNQSAQATE